MYNLKFTQFKPFSVGIDNFFTFAENFNLDTVDDGFPKYNILKEEDSYTIQLALAGYDKEDIDIELREGQLIVSHKKPKSCEKPDSVTFLHRGVTRRSFTKSFYIADNIIVDEASFINGLLCIHLKQIIPDEKKPKKIKIN